MSHCGNMGGRAGDILWSLRQPSTTMKGLFEPCLTFIYNPRDKAIGEMKGKANTKPKEEYHDKILALLNTEHVKKLNGSGYRAEVNFTLNDLNDARFLELVKSKPELVKAQINASDSYQKLDPHHLELLKQATDKPEARNPAPDAPTAPNLRKKAKKADEPTRANAEGEPQQEGAPKRTIGQRAHDLGLAFRAFI